MRLRDDARAILDAALAAANPSVAVADALRSRTDLDRYRRIFVVGAGKASGTMAVAAERVLGSRIAAGCVNVKDGDPVRLDRIEVRACGHPVPDERGLAGAKRIAEICSEAGEGDLVLCLISGGASALMPLPVAPVTLEDKRATTSLLLASGATIHEINTVRKHLSAIKGGQLTRLVWPAQVLSLIVSDVVGDDLSVIASGPTVPDATTLADARAVLERYGIAGSLGGETPKPGDPIFRRTENLIVGSNRKSLEAAAERATELGYQTTVLSSTVEGEAREVAKGFTARAREIAGPACLIQGGETTVTLHGGGKGGRNQEFALAAAMEIAGLANTLVMSVGTDGTDGPTDAAGAMADGDTLSRSRRRADAALATNDSYPFFEELGDLVITGPTGTNVMDLHVLLVG